MTATQEDRESVGLVKEFIAAIKKRMAENDVQLAQAVMDEIATQPEEVGTYELSALVYAILFASDMMNTGVTLELEADAADAKPAKPDVDSRLLFIPM